MPASMCCEGLHCTQAVTLSVQLAEGVPFQWHQAALQFQHCTMDYHSMIHLAPNTHHFCLSELLKDMFALD